MAAYTTIDDPSAHFQTLLHNSSGNTAASYTFDGNSDLQPDLVWHKNRTVTDENYLFDSTRGAENAIYSNSTSAEVNHGNSLTSFDSNGYSVGSSNVTSGAGTYASWCWKANGGTTSSNTDGTITSTVQANTDAGFSIVTWAGNASNATMGHGLGATPQVIISKARGTTNDWNVYHRWIDNSAPYNYLLNLHNTNGSSAATGSWGSSLSDINSSTFYKKYWINYNTNMIAYCFAEKQGYSKFGVYYGNGSTDGTFVYTGFKPAFVMVKRTNTTENWAIIDSTRDPYNLATKFLRADENSSETAGNAANMDLLSNGFKLRNTDTKSNALSSRYVYMAFAENPFVSSTGVPTTAR